MQVFEQEQFRESFEVLIIVCSAVLLTLFILVIILFTLFQKRKIKLITERNKAELQYLEEVARTQLEIQEMTLKNVSWELHDNIGQLLSVANLELNVLLKKQEPEETAIVSEIQSLVAKSLQEIRELSRSLNKEVINQLGIIKSTENELTRLEKLGILKTSLEVTGECWDLPQDDNLILFRIIQEFTTNVIKHAKADSLKFIFKYLPSELHVQASDNGVGFDLAEGHTSSGLINMKSRAALLNAHFDLFSEKGSGTILNIRYLKK
ncbi:sensor histidine kinase [Leeuwenhoekiella sp. W20_SRS_FM14]|uniref:sensor histidine kinase n=1 Tax=Leeuwenhoekiella sp. W20_SRS_FM14 TaxID=3240270 RepID=UPI003F944126